MSIEKNALDTLKAILKDEYLREKDRYNLTKGKIDTIPDDKWTKKVVESNMHHAQGACNAIERIAMKYANCATWEIEEVIMGW